MKFIKFFILIAIFFSTIIITYSFTSTPKVSIIGTSMLPSIHDNDSLFLLKNSNFKRGDIVTFNPPKNVKTYIKRIVGVPFDTLIFDSFGNLLSINGKEVPYLYISDMNIVSGSRVLSQYNQDIFFLMKPYLSKIDKNIFPIYFFDKKSLKKDSIEEKKYVNSFLNFPFLTENNYKVIVPENHYFMLSDNRVFGHDSRQFGFIHRNKILGIALK